MTVAKNYLTESELTALNNLVEQYLIFAEGKAMRRIPMKMKDWVEKLNGFLKLNDRNILEDAGKISHELAVEMAEKEYDKFNKKRLKKQINIENDFDKAIKMIEKKKKKK
ncbi:MAG: RhuM family protein [bacterium]